MAKRKFESGGAVEDQGYIELEGGPMTDEEHSIITDDTMRRITRGRNGRPSNEQDHIDAVQENERVTRTRNRENAKTPKTGTHRYAKGGQVRGMKWGKIT